MMQSLHLATTDGIQIAANYFPVDAHQKPSPLGWVVFLHMMPATKESWNALAEHLQRIGYAGIAIDLRGHGESEGGPSGYHAFSDAEHQNSMRDIDVAIDFLHGMGARDASIVLVGASIGANLALRYVAHHRAMQKAILISPGLDYHGIVTQPLITALPEGKNILFIASRDDDRVVGNAQEVDALHAMIPVGVDAVKEIVDTGGHGTALLDQHPELIETILTFITS